MDHPKGLEDFHSFQSILLAAIDKTVATRKSKAAAAGDYLMLKQKWMRLSSRTKSAASAAKNLSSLSNSKHPDCTIVQLAH